MDCHHYVAIYKYTIVMYKKKKVKSKEEEKGQKKKRRHIYICINIYTHKASFTIIQPTNFSACSRVSRLITFPLLKLGTS